MTKLPPKDFFKFEGKPTLYEFSEPIPVDRQGYFYTAICYTKTLYWLKNPIRIWDMHMYNDFYGVFLLQCKEDNNDIPEFHWIIAGNSWTYDDCMSKEFVVKENYMGFPCVYIWTGYPNKSDINSIRTPTNAVKIYFEIVKKWIREVKIKGNSKNVFPIIVPECMGRMKYAELLEIKFYC